MVGPLIKSVGRRAITQDRFYCFGTSWWLWWIVGSGKGGDDVKPELSHCRVHLPECSGDWGSYQVDLYIVVGLENHIISICHVLK